MIRAIMFDLDRTLVQSDKLKAEAYAIAVQRLRQLREPESRAIEAYRASVGASREVASQIVIDRLGLEPELRPLMAQYEASEPWQVLTKMRTTIYDEMVADQELSVAVIEPGPFGGTCLNRGCIPSKMLIHSADVAETIRSSELFGIKAEVSEVDWDFIVRRATSTVDADAQAVEAGNRQHPNVTVFKDSAKFVDDKVLDVAGELVTAESIVVAAGTRPRVPEIEGLSDVSFLTSDEALRLPKQPQRLVLVGGGYIAAEMAHFFGALGTEVTIIHRGSQLLRQEDGDVAARFTEVYRRRFRMLLNTTIQRASQQGDEIVLDVRR